MSSNTAPSPDSGQVYLCPMHRDVRQASAGKCPKCGMDLLPQGTRFALLRHMSKSPMMLAIMAAIMIAIMAAIMMTMV
jgi:Heavy metal binding domain